MTVTLEIRQLVRERAQRCCEFCGVSENDTAGLLTIDHFQPVSKGGSDQLNNLLYCCMRCNLYKQDYWPQYPDDLPLWNPRTEPASNHFISLDDGNLYPLTSIGDFTIKLLHLNRPQLIAYRVHKNKEVESNRLLGEYEDVMRLIEQLSERYMELITDEAGLLELQVELLRLLARRKF